MNRSLTRLLLACAFASVKALRLVLSVALVLCSASLALAQGSANSSLAGVVADAAGGVVPGATVTVKNNATGTTFETVTNTAGAFSIPVLDPGTYTVTVALSGFKTAVINDVRLLAATPGSIRATLEVGEPRARRSRSRAAPSSCRRSPRRSPRRSRRSRSPTCRSSRATR